MHAPNLTSSSAVRHLLARKVRREQTFSSQLRPCGRGLILASPIERNPAASRVRVANRSPRRPRGERARKTKTAVPQLFDGRPFVRRGQSHGGGQATRQGDCSCSRRPTARSWLERTRRRIPLSRCAAHSLDGRGQLREGLDMAHERGKRERGSYALEERVCV